MGSFPITDASGRPVRYAERDAIGVELSGNPRGVNADLAFVRAAYDKQTLEHNENGVHDTPKIARAFISLTWTGLAYRVNDESYHAGFTGPGVVTSATKVGTGMIEIVLAEPIGSAKMGVQDCTTQTNAGSFYTAAMSGDLRLVTVRFAGASAADTFTVARREGADRTSQALADGDCAFLVYSE